MFKLVNAPFTFPPKSKETAPPTLARLLQSPFGQINGHNSFKISFELTGGSLRDQEALAEGLATLLELKRRGIKKRRRSLDEV